MNLRALLASGWCLLAVLSPAFGQDSSFAYTYQGRTAVLVDGQLLVTDGKWMDTVYADHAATFHLGPEGEVFAQEALEALRATDPERHTAVVATWRSYEEREDHRLLSAVGPCLSYGFTWYAEGGAHPIYGTTLYTYDMGTKEPARLADFFAQEELFVQLMADSFIVAYLTETPKDLDELGKYLWSDCDFSFRDFLEHFAFHGITGDRVAVRIGFGHGCEVMRGNYHEITLHLPIPKALASALREADARESLMEDLE